MTRLEKVLVKAKREGQDISDFIHAYPVIEDINSVGHKRRKYAPLDLNKIKDLKKGCTLYGATSAYVKMLLDGLSYEVLTLNDWKSIARTCLESGQNLLWLADFHELCKIQVRCNLEIGVNTQFIFEHLAGEGRYGENSEQINYTMTIYEQIAKAAIKAWGVLLGWKDQGEAFTKIEQGPNEPFADFVRRLQTAVKRTIGENTATEIMTRHLAKENANKICKRIIWGLDKDAPVEEIIRRCSIVGTNAFYTWTMMNNERQDPSWQRTSRETRQCFQCGKIGHLRAQCKYGDRLRRQGKTPCPKCNRGLHWASECRLIQGKGLRGPSPGPQAKKTWGMMAADVTPKQPLEGQDSDLINQQKSNFIAERDYLISQPKGNQIAKMDYTWGEYRPFKPTGLCPVQTLQCNCQMMRRDLESGK
ncbi:endogenous retrovirus group K member 5 Gag polyprotein-like [Sminthopsis crassicaudata]|uniref:endogenous retrovirus group K member 5 Gag polyprotein-like n=1 Tax=Sminthopsis crassicaudata TaxID=9301 RepID=UPI003D69AF0E